MNNKELLLLLKELSVFMDEKLGKMPELKTSFIKNTENAKNPLGKTAFYDPNSKKISIYITNRHPKDLCRSWAHERVHAWQDQRDEFNNQLTTEEGYAQKDEHLREMEREAYEKGNMLFRDFEDQKKAKENLQEVFNKRNHTLYNKLMKNLRG